MLKNAYVHIFTFTLTFFHYLMTVYYENKKFDFKISIPWLLRYCTNMHIPIEWLLKKCYFTGNLKTFCV